MTLSDAPNCGLRVTTIIDDTSQDQDTGVIHDERHMTIKIYSQHRPQVAVPDMFYNFYLVKNHKIDNNSESLKLDKK